MSFIDRTRFRLHPAGALAFLLVLSLTSAAQSIERVSLSSADVEPNGDSTAGDLSLDGRWLVFETKASNLADQPDSGLADIYRRDRVSGTTQLVSAAMGTNDVEATGPSQAPQVSKDGRFVTYYTGSPNLTTFNASVGRVVQTDMQSGLTVDVSVRPDGSVVGSSVAFSASSTGRYVAFSTGFSGLVPGDNNGKDDVFVRDMQTGSTLRASTAANGAEGNNHSTEPAVTRDGRYVAFRSTASNLLPGVSGSQVYLKDLQSGSLELVSVSPTGVAGSSLSSSPAIADLGRFVAFQSGSHEIYPWQANPQGIQIYVRDLENGQTWPASASAGTPANNFCYDPSMSDDGRFTSFRTSGSNLDPLIPSGWVQIYVYDRFSEEAVGVSVDALGVAGNSGSGGPAISGDGRYIAFESSATNLVPGDTNAKLDVFLHDQSAGNVFDYGVGKEDSIGCVPRISATGTPSASAGSGFDINCDAVQNQKAGLLFFGGNGATTSSFLGGILYVKPPIRRGPLLFSGGSTQATDCSGDYTYDFNVRIASGLDPWLTLGTTVCAQYWSRDPADSTGTVLSNAVTFEIAP